MKIQAKITLKAFLLTLALLCPTVYAGDAPPTPYLWISAFDGDAAAEGIKPSEGASFSGALGNLDFWGPANRQAMRLSDDGEVGSSKVGLQFAEWSAEAAASGTGLVHGPDQHHKGYLGDGILKEGEDEVEELVHAVQNPVADLISLTFQNNTNFDFGPLEKTQNLLNIQPIIPISLTEKWLMVTRTIVPVLSQPAFLPHEDRELGLSDTLFTAFVTPRYRSLWLGNWLWEVGPTILLPTSTHDRLGPGEWGAGMSAGFERVGKRWVVGSLFRNVWSFTGDNRVNLFSAQPFLNYNFDHGWYLTSAPLITANWKAVNSDNTWTVPIGGGVGRVFQLGGQFMNASLQGYYNVVKPDLVGPDWSIRFVVQFLFPKGRSSN